MTVDVVCAGAPFLDLVFRGLDRLPGAGEEVLAKQLVVVPGAMANVAFALRQLGLDAAVCAPVGDDPAGRLLKDLMDAAGIPWIGSRTAATPVSVALPVDGERAFVTLHPSSDVDVAEIAEMRPRAVVANLPLADGLPEEPRIYGVVGDPQVTILLDRGEDSWAGLRALILNEREALQLSGRSDAPDAARQLAERGCLVVITRAEHGAIAVCPGGPVVAEPGVPVVALDTVGAGDLFTAAFVWADLADRSLEECLAVGTTYASHSLAAPGGSQKGLSRTAYLEATRSSRPPDSWMLEVRG
jgi:sugar/nucleoside kinase (ribokinase family)